MGMRTIAVILVALALAGCRFEGDFSESMETVILPAEEYQQEIAAVDRLLFREEPLGEAGPRELEQVIDGMAARVRKTSDTRFIQVETLELKLLAKRAGRLSPRGTGRELQNDWMRIRNNLFDDRAWFVRSAADLEYAASVVPPPQPQPQPAPPKPPRAIVAAPAFEARSQLTGQWRVVAITANGVPREDDELTGATWTFDAPRLVMRSPAGRETTFNFTPEGKHLRVSGPGEEGWILYDLAGGELRVAFHDGLQGKPASFEHDPSRTDPLLLVLRLAAVR